jgi:hypothetical protein
MSNNAAILKQKGNEAFSAKRYDEAIDFFTQVLIQCKFGFIYIIL